jgi:hypothetical protein
MLHSLLIKTELIPFIYHKNCIRYSIFIHNAQNILGVTFFNYQPYMTWKLYVDFVPVHGKLKQRDDDQLGWTRQELLTEFCWGNLLKVL